MFFIPVSCAVYFPDRSSQCHCTYNLCLTLNGPNSQMFTSVPQSENFPLWNTSMCNIFCDRVRSFSVFVIVLWSHFLLICCSCFCVWISNHASVLKGSHLYSKPCSSCIYLLIVPQRLYFHSNIPGEEIWIAKMLHIKCSNFKLFLFSEQISLGQRKSTKLSEKKKVVLICTIL